MGWGFSSPSIAHHLGLAPCIESSEGAYGRCCCADCCLMHQTQMLAVRILGLIHFDLSGVHGHVNGAQIF